MRMVKISTNPQGYRVHAVAVLKRYAPEKNQATPARYHISDHNFTLDISHSDCSVIGNNCRHSDPVFNQSIVQYDCVLGLHGDHSVLCRCRLNDTQEALQLPFRHEQMCGDAPTSYQQSWHNPSQIPSRGRGYSLWPGSAKCSNPRIRDWSNDPTYTLRLATVESAGRTPLFYPIRLFPLVSGKWIWLKLACSAGF